MSNNLKSSWKDWNLDELENLTSLSPCPICILISHPHSINPIRSPQLETQRGGGICEVDRRCVRIDQKMGCGSRGVRILLTCSPIRYTMGVVSIVFARQA